MPWRFRGSSDRGEFGATATEYGLLVLFIALVIVGGISIFGINLNAVFGRLAQWVVDTM
jgi:pilus assembly protein Flp/PilA